MRNVLTVVEPATGTVLDELPYLGAAEAAQAADEAYAALPAWSATPVAARARSLHAIAADLRESAEEIAVLISRETGKRLAEARAEVGLSAGFFDWFAAAISAQQGQIVEAVAGIRHHVRRRPLGVVAVSTPWNFPVSIPARKAAAALAAGCSVLFKPSEIAPLSALAYSDVVQRHVPDGSHRTVVGEPVAVTSRWLADSRVRGLSFTGSTRTGLLLAQQAAATMTRTVLELGGNAPFVVLDDADLDHAVETLLIAKYRNNGQSCIAANHVWVPSGLHDELVDRFASASAALQLGNPLDESTTLGPLTLPGDPERVAELLLDAEKRGAVVLRSPASVPEVGSFCAPAIVIDAQPGSRVLDEEVFGPAVAVRRYDSIDVVLAATRDCAHGLAGYVVGQDPTRARVVADALDVGIAGVGTATPNTPQIPFGGLKLSGVGYEGGQVGLEAFQTLQTVAIAQ